MSVDPDHRRHMLIRERDRLVGSIDQLEGLRGMLKRLGDIDDGAEDIEAAIRDLWQAHAILCADIAGVEC